MTDEEVWYQFSAACWNCGKSQDIFPQHMFCVACRPLFENLEQREDLNAISSSILSTG